MARERPVGGTVIGILNLVFSVLVLCIMTCGGGAVAVMVAAAQNAPPPPAGQPDPFKMFGTLYEEASREAPEMAAVLIAGAAVSLILHVILFIAGIGLLRLKPMGRKLSLFFAVTTLVLTFISAGYMLARGNAAMESAQKAMLEEAQKQQKQARPGAPVIQPMGNPFGGAIGTAINTVVSCMYPVAILIVMRMRKVRQAYSDNPAADTDDRDPPDDRDDGRWRD